MASSSPETFPEKSETFTHSSTLFTAEDGRPMKFYMRPCNVRWKLQPIVKHGGGIITSKLDQHCTKIADVDDTRLSDDYLDSRYIEDCVKQNRLLTIESYRLTRKRATSPVPSLSTSVMSVSRRSKFTKEEDHAILSYLAKHPYASFGGNQIWMKMVLLEITTHSWQSMRDRFIKRLKPNLDVYIARQTKKKLAGNKSPSITPPRLGTPKKGKKRQAEDTVVNITEFESSPEEVCTASHESSSSNSSSSNSVMSSFDAKLYKAADVEDETKNRDRRKSKHQDKTNQRNGSVETHQSKTVRNMSSDNSLSEKALNKSTPICIRGAKEMKSKMGSTHVTVITDEPRSLSKTSQSKQDSDANSPVKNIDITSQNNTRKRKGLIDRREQEKLLCVLDSIISYINRDVESNSACVVTEDENQTDDEKGQGSKVRKESDISVPGQQNKSKNNRGRKSDSDTSGKEQKTRYRMSVNFAKEGRREGMKKKNGTELELDQDVDIRHDENKSASKGKNVNPSKKDSCDKKEAKLKSDDVKQRKDKSQSHQNVEDEKEEEVVARRQTRSHKCRNKTSSLGSIHDKHQDERRKSFMYIDGNDGNEPKPKRSRVNKETDMLSDKAGSRSSRAIHGLRQFVMDDVNKEFMQSQSQNTQTNEINATQTVEEDEKKLETACEKIKAMMSKCNISVSAATSAVYQCSGSIADAKHYLQFGTLRSGHPLWCKEDEEKLLSSNPQDIKQLSSKYGQQGVFKHMEFIHNRSTSSSDDEIDFD
ncbi:uncharacterized protein LOC144439023 [Glandiceps talaboti]